MLRLCNVVLLGAFLGLVCRTHCISFSLEPNERRCVQEEVHKDVLVVGEYRLSDVTGQKTDLLVSLGETLAFSCRQCSMDINSSGA